MGRTQTIPALIFGLLFGLIALVGSMLWRNTVLSDVRPVVPVPPGAHRMDSREWSTRAVNWYLDTYDVPLSTEDVQAFYAQSGAHCASTDRDYRNQPKQVINCSGPASPTGWYVLDIEIAEGAESVDVVIEVSWDAGF